MKNLIVVFALMGILLTSGVAMQAVAAPNENANERAKSGPVISIPEDAALIGENTYYLGKSKDIDGTTLEGFVYVYRSNEYHEKPTGTPGKGPDKGETGDVQCFDYIGGEWNPATEGWVFNPTNGESMDIDQLFLDFEIDIQNWEAEAGKSILLDGVQNNTGSITVSNDGVNNIFFGDIDSEGAIAATWVWTTVGKPSLREIRAFDMVFDQVSFNWSNTSEGVENRMDFNNIAEHELGHAIGMAHPKDSSCLDETMWSTAPTQEIKKRTLNPGDIEGILQLYA